MRSRDCYKPQPVTCSQWTRHTPNLQGKGYEIMTVEKGMIQDHPDRNYTYELMEYKAFTFNDPQPADVRLSMFCNTFHELSFDEYEYFMHLYVDQPDVDVDHRAKLVNEFLKPVPLWKLLDDAKRETFDDTVEVITEYVRLGFICCDEIVEDTAPHCIHPDDPDAVANWIADKAEQLHRYDNRKSITTINRETQ